MIWVQACYFAVDSFRLRLASASISHRRVLKRYISVFPEFCCHDIHVAVLSVWLLLGNDESCVLLDYAELCYVRLGYCVIFG